jgi:hypothetical protein
MTAGPGLQLLSDSLAGLSGDQQLDEEEDIFSSEGGSTVMGGSEANDVHIV